MKERRSTLTMIYEQIAVATMALQKTVDDKRRFNQPCENLQNAEMCLLRACREIDEHIIQNDNPQ